MPSSMHACQSSCGSAVSVCTTSTFVVFAGAPYVERFVLVVIEGRDQPGRDERCLPCFRGTGDDDDGRRLRQPLLEARDLLVTARQDLSLSLVVALPEL